MNVKATKQHTRIDVHPATRFFALNKECGTFIIPYSLFRENFWGFFKTLFLPPWRHVRHISVWPMFNLVGSHHVFRTQQVFPGQWYVRVSTYFAKRTVLYVRTVHTYVRRGQTKHNCYFCKYIPSKSSYLILLHSWSRVSKIFEWVACYQEKSVLFVAVVVVVFSAGVPLLTSAGSNSGSNCVIGLARNLPQFPFIAHFSTFLLPTIW